MLNQLKNTVAFVSGGGSGLGLGTVKRLLDQGAKGVVAFDLRKSDYTHDRLMSIEGDVTKEKDVAQALNQCEQKFGLISAVVNCAGISYAARIYDHRKNRIFPLDEFKRVIEVNTVGTFNVSRLAAQFLVKNEMVAGQKGVIIMTSSVAAQDAQIGQAAYAASKGAVNGMTLAIARDLSTVGVRCVTIAPGLFDTPLLQGLPDKVRVALAATVPCPARLGDPMEYGHLVQTIIENPMLNGEVIRLDGALRMQP
jgi:3-hydroxyacyl-CoA dehydrogenase/3-hydroxy-2-methylbutyryl-CoA dehydrogenase